MSFFNIKTNSTHKIIIYGIVFLIVFILAFSGILEATSVDAATNSVAVKDVTPESCGAYVDLWVTSICFDSMLLAIAGFIFDVVGAFTGWMSEFLDMSIQFSLNSANYKIAGVTTGWEIVRDFANMAFIFILLYIAVMTILQLGGFQTKKILANLIIVALLVNFSFFITGVVIDASNVLANFLYNSMTPVVENTLTGPERQTLGAVFVAGLKIPSTKSEDPLSEAGLTEGVSQGRQAAALFLGSIVLLVAAFVFLAGGILFILRTGVLLLVLMMSPFAFIAAILPKTQPHWQKWVGHLTGTAFVAPIYLLLIAIVVGIISSDALLIAAGGQEQNLLSPFDYGSDDRFSDKAGIFLNYGLIIFLLIAAMTVSQQLASGIGGMSRKWAGRVTGFAAGAAMGAPSFAFRGAEKAMRGLAKAAKGESAAMKRVSKAATGASRRLASINKFSYDPRSTRLGKAAASGLKSTTGIDVGQAKRGREVIKERREQEKQDKETEERRESAQHTSDLQDADSIEKAAEVLARMTPQQVSKLSAEILVKEEVALNFNPAMLNAIATNKDLKLNNEARRKIREFATHPDNKRGGSNQEFLDTPTGASF